MQSSSERGDSNVTIHFQSPLAIILAMLRSGARSATPDICQPEYIKQLSKLDTRIFASNALN
jgi:hypothetical protein